MNEISERRPARGGFRLILTLTLLAVFAGGCSSTDNSTFTPPKTGALYTFMADAPACDVLSLRANVNGLTFRRAGTQSSVVTIFPTASLFVSLRMDYASLRDFSTVMYLSTLRADSYDRAELTFQLPRLAVYDASLDPPVRAVDAIFPGTKFQVELQPEFKVTDTAINVLRFDFDVARSLQFDAQGQVTDRVNPVVSAVAVPKGADNTFAGFDNLVGFVSSVSPNPVGAFIGSFNLQLHTGSGQAIPISLKSDTVLSGMTDLKSLETGRIAEAMVKVDDAGNFVADSVLVGNRINVDEHRIAFYGVVLPTPVKDANGDVTQLSLYIRGMDPDQSRDIARDSVLTVNIPSGTAFRVSPRPEGLTPLDFDPASVAIGQEVLVFGEYTLNQNLPSIVTAESVTLRSQTLQGGLSSLVQVASDGRTGAFWLSGCSSMLQTTPIMVMTTVTHTEFINVFGLAELSPQATLYVRGFPYYVKDATVIDGVPVPAGTLVLFARQVRQVN